MHVGILHQVQTLAIDNRLKKSNQGTVHIPIIVVAVVVRDVTYDKQRTLPISGPFKKEVCMVSWPKSSSQNSQKTSTPSYGPCGRSCSSAHQLRRGLAFVVARLTHDRRHGAHVHRSRDSNY